MAQECGKCLIVMIAVENYIYCQTLQIMDHGLGNIFGCWNNRLEIRGSGTIPPWEGSKRLASRIICGVGETTTAAPIFG